MKNKKIVLAGGTGFIGQQLMSHFGPDNEIVILTRNTPREKTNAFNDFVIPDALKEHVKIVYWDGKTVGLWAHELEDAALLINLAGKTVNCRYSDANKQAIFDSRTLPTKVLGQAVAQCVHPPALWINASSATIYRHAMDRPQDEFTGEIENDFSVQVCKLWEKTFFEQQTPRTRKIALRTAVTLANGGVMKPYLTLCKYGLGGKQGSGKQMYSWVHIEDICRIVDFLYERQDLEGVFNVSSPYPVTNSQFMQLLRKRAGHLFGLPAFAWMLYGARFFTGTEPELLLKSRWVLPTRLLNEGFVFKYAKLEDAFNNIISQMPRKEYRLL